jgi:uncharacterized membrane protein YdfJ with MMPL/SSD domain
MLYFVVHVVLVAIAVSLIGRWAKWVPRYPKLRHAFLFQVFNTGLLTIVLTFLGTAGAFPSWPVLVAVVLLILWLSVRCTNAIVQSKGAAPGAGSA